MTRRDLIELLIELEHFDTDILVLSGRDVAKNLVFRNPASEQLRIIDEDSDDSGIVPGL